MFSLSASSELFSCKYASLFSRNPGEKEGALPFHFVSQCHQNITIDLESRLVSDKINQCPRPNYSINFKMHEKFFNVQLLNIGYISR